MLTSIELSSTDTAFEVFNRVHESSQAVIPELPNRVVLRGLDSKVVSNKVSSGTLYADVRPVVQTMCTGLQGPGVSRDAAISRDISATGRSMPTEFILGTLSALPAGTDSIESNIGEVASDEIPLSVGTLLYGEPLRLLGPYGVVESSNMIGFSSDPEQKTLKVSLMSPIQINKDNVLIGDTGCVSVTGSTELPFGVKLGDLNELDLSRLFKVVEWLNIANSLVLACAKAKRNHSRLVANSALRFGDLKDVDPEEWFFDDHTIFEPTGFVPIEDA